MCVCVCVCGALCTVCARVCTCLRWGVRPPKVDSSASTEAQLRAEVAEVDARYGVEEARVAQLRVQADEAASQLEAARKQVRVHLIPSHPLASHPITTTMLRLLLPHALLASLS